MHEKIDFTRGTDTAKMKTAGFLLTHKSSAYTQIFWLEEFEIIAG